MLVHSAGGGVGIAAIQLARRIGARVIGTASENKHAALREMGVEHAIDSRREDFEARVRELTGGRGAELALDAVGAASFRKIEYWRQGTIRPTVAASFPFERAAEAHHFLQDRRNVGKVLLVP